MKVAETILEQLGGNKFLAMTGAHSLTKADDALTFKLPNGIAEHGINCVRVSLMRSADAYRVEFIKIKGTTVKKVFDLEHIGAASLKFSFEYTTGLRSNL